MILKSLRYLVGLGVVGGLAVVLAPSAHAQTTANTTTTSTQTQTQNGIEVTGGKIAGEAAFFLPGLSGTGAGQVTLFDVGAINTLQIQSPNGTTTTAQFNPTAASFTDVNNNKKPDANDTGVLQGGLTGVAFTQQGVIIPYVNVDTVLGFKLNTFTPTFSDIAGTLISPKTGVDAAPIFLPNVEAQLSSQTQAQFEASTGKLQFGNFDAALNNGLIDLPSNYLLGNAGGAVISQPSIVRKLKFEFEGQNLAANSYTFDATSSSLDFA
ncbi:MAG TPA: hypothetical protein V6C95_13525, partial [Coleofasciculaceae cyanobacterium]